MTGPNRSEPAATVTLHSSWRGIVGSFSGAFLLLFLGALAVSASGWSLLSGGLLVVGVVMSVGTSFDYPIQSTFGPEGIERRCVLRRQHLPWDRVRQLTRSRSSLFGGGSRLGGLAAIVGRRRYLLVDQAESGAEHDALDELLGEARSESVGFDGLMRPGDDVNPTWIYRRGRWRPPTST